MRCVAQRTDPRERRSCPGRTYEPEGIDARNPSPPSQRSTTSSPALASTQGGHAHVPPPTRQAPNFNSAPGCRSTHSGSSASVSQVIEARIVASPTWSSRANDTVSLESFRNAIDPSSATSTERVRGGGGGEAGATASVSPSTTASVAAEAVVGRSAPSEAPPQLHAMPATATKALSAEIECVRDMGHSLTHLSHARTVPR